MDKDTIPQFGAKWDKYVDSLEKKIAVNTQRQNRATNASLLSPSTVDSILETEEEDDE